MESHFLISLILFICTFFGVISLLQLFSKKISLPFTVLLLLSGFLAQALFHFLHLETEVTLRPELIYFLLLPILLFESAMHINIHQFRLQFWTITFISTFGLLVSMFIVGFGLSYMLGMPLGVALLFGALISATDPIAVLSIFKSLGAPKRLSLIADGESMFNDATAVLAFKVVAAFVLAGSFFQSGDLFSSIGNFLYVFFGSIFLGSVLGYVSSELIRLVKNDHFVEASITLALALGSFILSDHYLHLSGVITTVMAGIVFGNFGKTRISTSVTRFVNRIWEYMAFLAVSLVFFFASFQLNLGLLLSQLNVLHVVIIIVLIARAISVYLSFFLSNKLPLFKDEPDVPLSWQHILNWGGLRGVIPLVLVYSLPDNFIYKDTLISFTLACLVFTLFINALTIRPFLVWLKLHLPKKEEEIIKDEQELFIIEQKKLLLKTLPKREFYDTIVKIAEEKLTGEEKYIKLKLLNLASEEDLLNGLKLQAIEISREKLLELFQRGYITEAIVNEYGAQLDLQQDALEYPEVYYGRGFAKGGRLPNKKLFRERLRGFERLIRNFPVLKIFIGWEEEEIILERLMMLKAKILCVDEIINYLERVRNVFEESKEALKVIKEVEEDYKERKRGYEEDVEEIKINYESTFLKYQQNILKALI